MSNESRYALEQKLNKLQGEVDSLKLPTISWKEAVSSSRESSEEQHATDGLIELLFKYGPSNNNNFFRLPSETDEASTMKKLNKGGESQWSFHAICPEYEIDFKDIEAHLSKKNPIALVEVDGEQWQGWVVFHQSLVQKAIATGDKDVWDVKDNILKLDYAEDASYWVHWARKIKRAEWLEDGRNPGKVTVTLRRI